jgi:hypothetical protein
VCVCVSLSLSLSIYIYIYIYIKIPLHVEQHVTGLVSGWSWKIGGESLLYISQIVPCR